MSPYGIHRSRLAARRNETAAYEAEDDEPMARSAIETVSNHIYFYSEIRIDRAHRLIASLRELDAQLQEEARVRETKAAPIWLHLYSIGGDMFASLAVADAITYLRTPVRVLIEGVCASGATLIALACSKRYMMPSAFMCIHQLSTGMFGTHEQFEDEILVQNKLMETMLSVYVRRSNLTESELREHLKRDFWMNAQEALAFGFVDAVYTGGSR